MSHLHLPSLQMRVRPKINLSVQMLQRLIQRALKSSIRNSKENLSPKVSRTSCRALNNSTSSSPKAIMEKHMASMVDSSEQSHQMMPQKPLSKRFKLNRARPDLRNFESILQAQARDKTPVEKVLSREGKKVPRSRTLPS